MAQLLSRASFSAPYSPKESLGEQLQVGQAKLFFQLELKGLDFQNPRTESYSICFVIPTGVGGGEEWVGDSLAGLQLPCTVPPWVWFPEHCQE